MIKEVLESFLVGRDNWSEMESKLMPRNSRDVLRPAVFSDKRGTLSS